VELHLVELALQLAALQHAEERLQQRAPAALPPGSSGGALKRPADAAAALVLPAQRLRHS
jgi:hypothetical protein